MTDAPNADAGTPTREEVEALVAMIHYEHDMGITDDYKDRCLTCDVRVPCNAHKAADALTALVAERDRLRQDRDSFQRVGIAAETDLAAFRALAEEARGVMVGTHADRELLAADPAQAFASGAGRALAVVARLAALAPSARTEGQGHG